MECVSNKKNPWKIYEHHQIKNERHPSRVINEEVLDLELMVESEKVRPNINGSETEQLRIHNALTVGNQVIERANIFTYHVSTISKNSYSE